MMLSQMEVVAAAMPYEVKPLAWMMLAALFFVSCAISVFSISLRGRTWGSGVP